MSDNSSAPLSGEQDGVTPLPCPFCGTAIRITPSHRDEHGVWAFGCGICGIVARSLSLERAMAAWNRRSSSPDGLTAPERRITGDDVEAIEEDIGMGCGAWDMVPPETIIRATLRHFGRPTGGLTLIADERQRQVAHGYDAGKDDQYTSGELEDSALLMLGGETLGDDSGILDCAQKLWERYRGRGVHDDIRRLTIAAAFIVAEIERLQRKSWRST